MISEDPTLPVLRERTCRAVADGLAAAGHELWQQAWMHENRRAEGLALVVQMAGQLAQEICDAFSRERWYAGASMTRQLVELHYLLARFDVEPQEAERWLGASTNRIEKSFNPATMRALGGFHVGEYKSHCTFGGHPNPRARWVVCGRPSGAAHITRGFVREQAQAGQEPPE